MVRPKLMPAVHWSATPVARVLHPIQEFIHNSAAGGILLMLATLLALLVANSPLADAYDAALHAYFTISLGPFEIRENLMHWINDGLMAIFFFLIGLEIKRELWVGELASPRAALLPIAAAIGGVAVPALIYAGTTIEGRPRRSCSASSSAWSRANPWGSSAHPGSRFAQVLHHSRPALPGAT